MNPVPIPELYARRVGEPGRESLEVFCDHCEEYWHHGGGSGPGDGNGHRLTHCQRDDCPYADSGYYITELVE